VKSIQLTDLSITDTGNAVGYPNQLQNNERPGLISK
jgi:hypothetical protein